MRLKRRVKIATFELELLLNGTRAWHGPIAIPRDGSTLHVDLPVAVTIEPAPERRMRYGITPPGEPAAEQKKSKRAERMELSR